MCYMYFSQDNIHMKKPQHMFCRGLSQTETLNCYHLPRPSHIIFEHFSNLAENNSMLA